MKESIVGVLVPASPPTTAPTAHLRGEAGYDPIYF